MNQGKYKNKIEITEDDFEENEVLINEFFKVNTQ